MKKNYSIEIINLERRKVLATLAGTVAIGAALSSPLVFSVTQSVSSRTDIVRTSYGPVCGHIGNGIHIFKGIRYGAPAGGENRFMPPQKPQPWTEVFNATTFGNSAKQGVLGGIPMDPSSPLAQLIGVNQESETTSEDCLFLNVYTPEAGDARRRPVMVWLHGGGFALGSGSLPTYDGTALANQGDVVVITVNHRLDVFGYAQLDHLLGPKYQSSGQAGMLDIVAALEWVRDNVAAFGGDPDNVTIFGESGGGMKVSILLAMPKAKGLFHRAIIQSGPGEKMVPRSDGQSLATMLLEELEITPEDAHQLLTITEDKLISAASRVAARAPQRELGRSGFAPVVDGIELPRDPFDPTAPELSADIPLMIGTTANEMSLFLLADPEFGQFTWESAEERLQTMLGNRARPALELHRNLSPDASPTDVLADIMTQISMRAPSVLIAERKAVQDGAPAWLYRVDWHSPALGGVLRATHGIDVALVFNNTDKSKTMMGTGPEAKAVANQMSATWIAFARTGDPNNATIPNWPAYSPEKRDVMLFNLKSEVASDPERDARLFWSEA